MRSTKMSGESSGSIKMEIMKRISSIVFLAMCLIWRLNAQRIETILVPFEKNSKWGYVNFEDSLIVDAVFEEAYPTYGSRGRIKLKGKYGFINENGHIVIKPKFDTAKDFRHGITEVSRKGKTKYIKPDGKENKYGIALCGGIYIDCLYPISFFGLDTFKVGDKYGIKISKRIRVNGEIKYYPDTLGSFFDTVKPIGRGFAILGKGDKKAIFKCQSSYHNTVNVDSTMKFKYEEFKFFPCQGDSSRFHDIFGFKSNNKWGFIELYHKPEELIEAKYISINSLERGLTLVEYEEGKFGYVNKYGKEYFKRN